MYFTSGFFYIQTSADLPQKSPFRFHDLPVGNHFDHSQRAYPALVIDSFASVTSAVRVRSIRYR